MIFVGGFLGAGKTTLLWEAARRLANAGRRVGLITNDQAPGLVDTAFLAREGAHVAEVSGSCFCCNYPGLLDAMARLREEAHVDVLIAEPVGSCTDLSATIVQPLKDRVGADLVVAPLSVLVDATRFAHLFPGTPTALHPSALYILRKQIEEADIVVISKADLVGESDVTAMQRQLREMYPDTAAVSLSAKTGAGLREWLHEVTTRTDAGRNLADVDYDVYAEGEAALGWLNATYELEGTSIDGGQFVSDLLTALSRRFDRATAPVGHVKAMFVTGDGSVLGNLTGGAAIGLTVRGTAAITDRARFIVNARVQQPPEALADALRGSLASVCEERIRAVQVEWHCLSPARPKPTHRYDRVVGDGD